MNKDNNVKLSYLICYDDSDGNTLQNDDEIRDNFDLFCTACGSIVPHSSKEEAEETMHDWNFCPFCGMRLYKGPYAYLD